jgi:hypothetical protein
MHPQLLLARLDQIGDALDQSGHALALIGLGSVGLERDRLDEYSDLDFFVIVEAGYKSTYLNLLDWLGNINPIAYCFRNTSDGYKLLFEDGIFCEFAVFELDELQDIPYAPGRIVWKRPHVSDAIAQPVIKPLSRAEPERDWLVGEALTNLYVGLNRDRRGEKLSAMRFIQHYAVDRLLELTQYIDTENSLHRDPFVNERRIEYRYPNLTLYLPNWAQGYDRNRESARAILGFLQEHFHVDAAMAKAIRNLVES